MKLINYLGIGLAVFFILVNVNLSSHSEITGASIIKDYSETDKSYAYNLDMNIKDFFNTNTFIFPDNVCGDVARDIYIDLSFKDVDVITGFDSKGIQKVASLNFVTDRLRRYGTVDLIKGDYLLKDYSVDTMISFNVESIVAVPKEQRANFISMDLMGIQEGPLIYITKGRYSTPSFDCAFTKYNGDVVCRCDAHPIQGIEVAGITASIPNKEFYNNLQEELDLLLQKKQ